MGVRGIRSPLGLVERWGAAVLSYREFDGAGAIAAAWARGIGCGLEPVICEEVVQGAA